MLAETYGIMVYQEQVMQVGQLLGGYSLGGADLLRRAMGKKKPEEMAQHREIFRAGAAKNGIAAQKADEIFDLMEKFAGYGFNKSHAAAYSLLAYHTAWLKVHHTAEFYAANMTIELDNTDKLKCVDRRRQAFAYRLRCRPTSTPAVTASSRWMRSACATGSARSRAPARARSRRSSPRAPTVAPFKSLFDFCARVDRSAHQQARRSRR